MVCKVRQSIHRKLAYTSCSPANVTSHHHNKLITYHHHEMMYITTHHDITTACSYHFVPACVETPSRMCNPCPHQVNVVVRLKIQHKLNTSTTMTGRKHSLPVPRSSLDTIQIYTCLLPQPVKTEHRCTTHGMFLSS